MPELHVLFDFLGARYVLLVLSIASITLLFHVCNFQRSTEVLIIQKKRRIPDTFAYLEVRAALIMGGIPRTQKEAHRTFTQLQCLMALSYFHYAACVTVAVHTHVL